MNPTLLKFLPGVYVNDSHKTQPHSILLPSGSESEFIIVNMTRPRLCVRARNHAGLDVTLLCVCNARESQTLTETCLLSLINIHLMCCTHFSVTHRC